VLQRHRKDATTRSVTAPTNIAATLALAQRGMGRMGRCLLLLCGILVAIDGLGRRASTGQEPPREDVVRQAAGAVEGGGASTGVNAAGGVLRYPSSPTEPIVDDYHGTAVADPYRWLEDIESPQTKAWVKSQNELTASYLDSIPQRGSIRQRLTELWNYERHDLPVVRQGRYFFMHNNGLQNQSVLYTALSLDGPRKPLIDPNQLSDDGTVALVGWSPSNDGRLLAYALADGGSDWRTWRIRNVETETDLEDQIRWTKLGGIAWMASGEGFFYASYDPPRAGQELLEANYFQKLYYHQVGSPQSEDVLVYQREDQKEWGFAPEVTEDGRYLVITITQGTDQKNQLFVKDLEDADAPVFELVSGFDAEYDYVGSDDRRFYVLTDDGAPRRRLVAIDLDQPQRDQWEEVIAESAQTLKSASLLGDRFFCVTLADAISSASVYSIDGAKQGSVELPGLGTVAGFGGRRDQAETFYSFANYITPTTIYRYDLSPSTEPKQRSSLWRKPNLPLDVDQFVTEQVFYVSKDGTRIPMLLTYRKDIPRDGNRPTLLYAFGGFNVSVTPEFSQSNAVWIDMGGIYAVPNIRGGGEYGRQWHEAGMMDRKQNSFDDFIAASEFLIRQQYTQPSRLAIRGRSNSGGLLVTACMTQRPELFAVCLPAVGLTDMLRFHRFTIGWKWISEFGCSEQAEQFPYLLSYSPLHNIRSKTCYPATLITTADRDDRVVPGHSFKFAAALQAAQGCDRAVLIRVEQRAGHGAGMPIRKRIDEAADTWTFLFENLHMDAP
jgi:prolyl oligopeptidase